jgi:hypothetical protein
MLIDCFCNFYPKQLVIFGIFQWVRPLGKGLGFWGNFWRSNPWVKTSFFFVSKCNLCDIWVSVPWYELIWLVWSADEARYVSLTILGVRKSENNSGRVRVKDQCWNLRFSTDPGSVRVEVSWQRQHTAVFMFPKLYNTGYQYSRHSLPPCLHYWNVGSHSVPSHITEMSGPISYHPTIAK